MITTPTVAACSDVDQMWLQFHRFRSRNQRLMAAITKLATIHQLVCDLRASYQKYPGISLVTSLKLKLPLTAGGYLIQVLTHCLI